MLRFHPKLGQADTRKPTRANDRAIWLAPAVLGLPFLMPLAVMIFEFIGILVQCAGWVGGGRSGGRGARTGEEDSGASGAGPPGENGT